MIEILLMCPANCTTGGPEAIHAFAHELNQIDGVHARIWYVNVSDYQHPCPPEYEAYEFEYLFEIPDDYTDVLIVPEIWANKVMEYPQCIRAIWWLGLDAYAGWTPAHERGAFLNDPDIIHICQSQYALDFLKKLGVKRLVKCTDTVNADFYEDYTEPERSDVVLYNPAKSTRIMRELIASCPDITWKPITGMTRQQVILTMRRSKLYVDFGEFPGRERIPREAALCGCCLITSKIGAAAYAEDFLHDYKFDSKDNLIWGIVYKIRYVLDHYDECRKDFIPFRTNLVEDRLRFKTQCREVINEIQHYYPGVQR